MKRLILLVIVSLLFIYFIQITGYKPNLFVQQTIKEDLKEKQNEVEKPQKEKLDTTPEPIKENLDTKKEPTSQASQSNGNTKVIYFTFDDGPDPEITPLVLDVLKEQNIRATFFIRGDCAEKYPELIKRILDEGHVLGNHTYWHYYKPDFATFRESVERTEKFVFNNFGYRMVLFRPPGGYDPPKGGVEYLHGKNIVSLRWDVDSLDSRDQYRNDVEGIVSNTIEGIGQVKNKNYIVALFHDGHNQKAICKAIPQIAKSVREMGYEIRQLTPEQTANVTGKWAKF